MNDSTNRALVSSSVTVFGGTCSSPGSNSSCERSRNTSYIGWGNVGATKIGRSGSDGSGARTACDGSRVIVARTRTGAVTVGSRREIREALRKGSCSADLGGSGVRRRLIFVCCATAAFRKFRAAALSKSWNWLDLRDGIGSPSGMTLKSFAGGAEPSAFEIL